MAKKRVYKIKKNNSNAKKKKDTETNGNEVKLLKIDVLNDKGGQDG